MSQRSKDRIETGPTPEEPHVRIVDVDPGREDEDVRRDSNVSVVNPYTSEKGVQRGPG